MLRRECSHVAEVEARAAHWVEELEAIPVPLSGIEPTVTPFWMKGREPEYVPVELGLNTTLKVKYELGAISRSVGTSATLNPDPETVKWDNCIFALETFLIWIVREMLVPEGTFPKLTLEGAAVIPGVTVVPEPELEPVPVPLSGSEPTVTPFWMKGREPEYVPAELGLNTTLKVKYELGAISRSVGTFATLNPDPETVKWDNCIFALETFLIWIVREMLVPEGTFPKLTLDGAAVIPADVTVVPEPELEAIPAPISGTEYTVAPFTMKGREPEYVPVELGLKTTLKVKYELGAISRSVGTFARLNPDPETENWANCAFAVETFLIVSV